MFEGTIKFWKAKITLFFKLGKKEIFSKISPKKNREYIQNFEESLYKKPLNRLQRVPDLLSDNFLC